MYLFMSDDLSINLFICDGGLTNLLAEKNMITSYPLLTTFFTNGIQVLQHR